MSLENKVMQALKEAMKAKDTLVLQALRAVKSALLLAKTEKAGADQLAQEDEIKLVQKLVKQRKDSAAIYQEQGRDDLAKPELEEAKVIAQFLPEQLSENEIATIVSDVIAKLGATTMKDMGKVMGTVSKQLAGKADGKTISTIVKRQLS